ncbi:hypothetical protein [Egibacter rhizosphaerae]|uniref:hypothetical protein n=1 Tax=Egibacter rhizosphaerae TaxID=1670831 RepID=UPI0013F16E5C|nr:hypothetical protein [Egibacter rhizosphaerae]
MFRLVAVLALFALVLAACDVDDGQEDLAEEEDEDEVAAEDGDVDEDEGEDIDDADEGETVEADGPPEPLEDFPRRPIEMTVAYPPGEGRTYSPEPSPLSVRRSPTSTSVW